ncbi:unnamed protein product [Lepidochelys olivacea]
MNISEFRTTFIPKVYIILRFCCISNAAELLVYIHFATATELKEEFLFCRSLPTQVTCEELFKLLNNFLQDTSFDWGHCFGICSDGGESMIRCVTVPRLRLYGNMLMNTYI